VAVNELMQGMRVQVKASHLPGYEDFVWMRCLNRTVRELNEDEYAIEVELGAPKERPDVCANLTASGFYPALGSATSDATGNVWYGRPGLAGPVVPTPFAVGSWHFPAFGAGVDFAGDCTSSYARILVVGEGQAEIHTAQYTAPRTLTATLKHSDGGIVEDQVIEDIAAGSTFTVDVSTHGNTICAHWIDVTDDGDTCGGKWGFAGFESREGNVR
jgi:hypothetical protein